jgi:hypothetical protein
MPSWKKLVISGSSPAFADITATSLTLDTQLAVAQGGTGVTSLNNLITLGTHTTGNYVGTITGGTNLTSTAATSGEGTTHTLNVDDAFLVNNANDTTTGTITAGGFTTTGELSATTRKFTKTSVTAGDYNGDVVYFGGTELMTRGAIYHFKSDGRWELADPNAVATCDGLLAVALGAASDDNGMLLRGMVTLDHDPGTIGDVLYLSAVDGASGDASSTAPSGDADIIRIIGYCLDSTNGQIWFDPDKTFVEVTA